MANKVQFQATDLEAALTARTAKTGSIGLTARRDLSRYYQCMASELQSLHLSEAEAAAICDYLYGFLAIPGVDSLGSLPLALALGVDEHVCRDRGVSVVALNEKLRALTWAQRLALVDAVERFWLNPTGKDRLQRVGLVSNAARAELAESAS